ncbi:hypothetical protein BC938DRAFT_475405 [Jimgerdemannia flammicorona]|nr:hypothetical protein BC938DRAFT_475405 [Jimgerdemannia flammicorona]
MHCRPDLRDEWVSGGDVDAELEDALSQEHNLRSLIKFYNERHYPDIFGNSNDSDNQSPQIDDDGVPTDFPSVHVIPDEIALDDTFIHNYERWLDSEVYSVPASPSSPTSSRTFFDDGYDSTDDIDIPLPGSDNWDNPTVYSHEMESSRDALFCNINWDSGGDVLAQQILAEQYNKNGWPVEIDVNDEDSLKILDSMAGCWIDAEDTHDGVRPGDPNWDQQAGQ